MLIQYRTSTCEARDRDSTSANPNDRDDERKIKSFFPPKRPAMNSVYQEKSHRTSKCKYDLQRKKKKRQVREETGYTTNGQVGKPSKVLTRESPTFTGIPAVNIVSIVLALYLQLRTGGADMAGLPTLEALPASTDGARSGWGATVGNGLQVLQ